MAGAISRPSPIALALAAACAVSKSAHLTTAVLVFTGAVIQLLMLAAALIPQKKLTNIMGYPELGPHPLVQLKLVVNRQAYKNFNLA
ncbi:MAG: hypothetical protein CAK88_08675 [Verrucomicrobiia bacterium AMD-G2]|nr:MAG: hypothetical protein CAK88_08675 [Verrucomicrobiae bacterium AMD-G2]